MTLRSSPNAHLKQGPDNINFFPPRVNAAGTLGSSVLPFLDIHEGVLEVFRNHLWCLNTFNEPRWCTLGRMDVRRGNVVNTGCDELYQAVDKLGCNLNYLLSKHSKTQSVNYGAYSWGTSVKIEDILVKGIAVELDGHNLLGRRISNAQRLLEAFQDSLAILMGVLGED